MREAIILAGGFGTRLRHVVSDVPKPMAPVCGRPFLEYLLDHLNQYHFDHVILSTGYLHDKIEQHFGTSYQGVAIDYAFEDHPLGTGGGILNALSCCSSDSVAVINGDTMFRVDFEELYRFHELNSADLSVILRKVDDTSRYGSVRLNNDCRIAAFVEKSSALGPGLINGGIYMLSKSLFEGFSVGDTFSFEKDIMEKQVSRKSFFAYASDAYFIDIGVPEDYFRFCDDSKKSTKE